jgi:hypothetical protein
VCRRGDARWRIGWRREGVTGSFSGLAVLSRCSTNLSFLHTNIAQHCQAKQFSRELEDEGEFVPQLVTLVSDIARSLAMLMMGGEYAKDVQQVVL